MKQWILMVAMLSTLYGLSGQTIFDAVRFSTFDPGATTARSLGAGGTLGAFGGDFSVINGNPAGLGSYWTSEVILAPAVPINTTTTFLSGDLSNEDTKGTKGAFAINTVGLVLNKRARPSSKWKTFNFAIGFQQQANFAGRSEVSGRSEGSITDVWRDDYNNDFINQFGSQLAEETDILILDTTVDTFFTDLDEYRRLNGVEPSLLKEQEVQTRGSLNELSFSFAGNLNNKLQFGVTLGIPFVDYTEERTYREIDVENIPVFNSITYGEYLNTSGVGINAKLGFIYRATKALRLGAAVHTPTAYSFTDNFYNDLAYDYTLIDPNTEEIIFDGVVESRSPDGTFDYKFRSPWRYMGNLGYIITQKQRTQDGEYRTVGKGFFSAEVEYVDYGKAEFNLTSDTDSPVEAENERLLNEEIANSLADVINVRLGGELVHNKLRFRAGFNISGIALAADSDVGTSFSLGTGFRGRAYYVDLGYRYSQFDGFNTYFDVDGTTGLDVSTENVSHRIVLTLGYKF